MRNPTKNRSAWLNTTPDIACSQLKLPNAATSDIVLRSHDGIGEKVPILLRTAAACASIPNVATNKVAIMMETTLRPYPLNTTASTRTTRREQTEMRTVAP